MPSLPILLDDYESLSRLFPIEDRIDQFKDTLRFEDNLRKPIHRWFNFKEGFSSKLVAEVITEFALVQGASTAFLDPFAGVGTSLLAAEETFQNLGVKNLTLRGIEINPYIHFVAQTKLAWDKYDSSYFQGAVETTLNGIMLNQMPSVPELSTLQNQTLVPRKRLHLLMQLRDKVRLVAKGRAEKRPLLLGVAAAAEELFNLRKDGRALRYTPRTKKESSSKIVMRKWQMIAEDLPKLSNRRQVDCRVQMGDGRRADEVLKGMKFQNIFFSPPYPNNIDYTEVYKIELWLLGFVTSGSQMLCQRRNTFRSHPSCTFPDFPDASSREVSLLLGAAFSRFLDYSKVGANWRKRLFGQYFADMLRTLRGCYRLLETEGRLFIVIGNSLHGHATYPIPVAADLWTACLAPFAGLKVEKIFVGRRFARRQFTSPILRESLLILSKK